ncbi:MAG: DUF4920 domain-containing protein [Bacteroidota bacterium]
MKQLFILLLAAASLVACNQKVANNKSAAATEIVSQASNNFGARMTAEDAIPFADLMQKMEDVDSMQVKVRGTVEAVCQKKGCWMNIVSTETDKQMFVKFKDYGFFVPLDISGQEVIMEGYAYREVTPIEELRHYAEDAGKSAEEIAKITEPEEAFKFLASGVIVMEN